jgi:hypothetical protein
VSAGAVVDGVVADGVALEDADASAGAVVDGAVAAGADAAGAAGVEAAGAASSFLPQAARVTAKREAIRSAFFMVFPLFIKLKIKSSTDTSCRIFSGFCTRIQAFSLTPAAHVAMPKLKTSQPAIIAIFLQHTICSPACTLVLRRNFVRFL